jgi:hypothetical protein
LSGRFAVDAETNKATREEMKTIRFVIPEGSITPDKNTIAYQLFGLFNRLSVQEEKKATCQTKDRLTQYNESDGYTYQLLLTKLHREASFCMAMSYKVTSVYVRVGGPEFKTID